MKIGLLLATGLLAMAPASQVVPAEEEAHHLVYPAEKMQWRDGPPSFEQGSQMAVLEGDPAREGYFAMQFRLPDGFRIAPHWHPKPERVTVLSGTLHLGTGEKLDPKATTALRPGSYFSMSPGMRHFVIAEGETVIQLTSVGPWEIIYVNREDDPRLRVSVTD